jgi:hypothetical protein
MAMATPRASAISSREAPAFRALSVWMVMQPSEWVVTLSSSATCGDLFVAGRRVDIAHWTGLQKGIKFLAIDFTSRLDVSIHTRLVERRSISAVRSRDIRISSE